MTVEAATMSSIPGTVHSAPNAMKDFSRGFTSLLFTFAGHSSNIEVADVMNDQKTYDLSYFFSYLYVFTLTMPVSVKKYCVSSRTYHSITARHVAWVSVCDLIIPVYVLFRTL
jgi:hypothetical protein